MSRAEGALSDSEEDKGPQAVPQQNSASAWSSKQPTEQGGSSSEASSERGERSHMNLIQTGTHHET